MKKYLYGITIMLFATANFYAQTITVFDLTTRQTIPGVIIYSNNPKTSLTTNAKGQVDITALKNADTIYIRYAGYTTITYNYAQIEAKKFKLELTETGISINEIVIAANRWEEKKIEVPYRIEKINMKDVALQNPQTSADLLGSGGYVYVQKSQLAGGSPIIRGFATNRVMLVVDGVRMNNAIFRSGNLQNVISLDASAFESAEILFGPGAVMYGSDAIGGVMDFHTKETKLSTDSNTSFTGSAFTRYSSANSEKTGHIDFNLGFKKWAVAANITFSDYEDLKTGTHGNTYYLRPYYQQSFNGKDSIVKNSDPYLQINSGYHQINFQQKIKFTPNNKWDIDYGVHYSLTSNAARYDRLTLDANKDGIFDNAEWYYGPQKWVMNRLGIKHANTTQLYDHVRLIAAMQQYEESRHDRRFNSKKIRHQTESVDAISINIDLDKKISEQVSLFYGIESVYNKIGSVANREHITTNIQDPPINTRYPNGSIWQTHGIYLSMKYKFNEKIFLNTGVRYSYYNIVAKFDTTLFPYPFTTATNKNGAINGGVGLVYSPNNNWHIYANASTGFRAPNIDDMGKVFESEPGFIVVPNNNLKPEYAYNSEIGSARTFGDFLKIEVSAYYTYLDKALSRSNFKYNGADSMLYDGQMSRIQAIQNISDAYVYGIQGCIDIYFGKGFILKNTFNYSKGKEKSIDSLTYYPMSQATPMYGGSHLKYERKKLKLDLYVTYNGEMKYDDFSLSERNDNHPYSKNTLGLPFVASWYTFNFKTVFYINQYFSINAGIENIFDQLYRPYGSGITSPGRNIILSLRGKF